MEPIDLRETDSNHQLADWTSTAAEIPHLDGRDHPNPEAKPPQITLAATEQLTKRAPDFFPDEARP